MSKHRNEHRQNQQNAPDAKQPPDHCNVDWPAVYPVKIEPSTEDTNRYSDEHEYRKKQFRVAVVLNYITFGAAAVGLLGLIYLNGQLSVSQGQLKTMTGQLDEMRLDERPWVQVSIDDVLPKESSADFGVLHLSNSGKTPARAIRVEVKVETVKNGDDPKLDYYGATEVATTGVIFPNAKPLDVPARRFTSVPMVGLTVVGPRPTMPDPISRDELLGFGEKRIFFVIYAKVTYIDFSNISHWTQFCTFTASPNPGGVSAKKCTAYNAVDTNTQ